MWIVSRIFIPNNSNNPLFLLLYAEFNWIVCRLYQLSTILLYGSKSHVILVETRKKLAQKTGPFVSKLINEIKPNDIKQHQLEPSKVLSPWVSEMSIIFSIFSKSILPPVDVYLISEKYSLKNQVRRTGFQPTKINFDINFCRLHSKNPVWNKTKIHNVELDFFNLIF